MAGSEKRPCNRPVVMAAAAAVAVAPEEAVAGHGATLSRCALMPCTNKQATKPTMAVGEAASGEGDGAKRSTFKRMKAGAAPPAVDGQAQEEECATGVGGSSDAAPAPAPAPGKKEMIPLPLAEVKWILAQKREPYTDPDDIEGFRSSCNPNDNDGFPEELKASCRNSIRRCNIMRKVEDDFFFEYQRKVRAAMESDGRFMVDADFFARRARYRAKVNEAWAKALDGLPLSDSDSDVDEEDEEDMALLAAMGLEFD